jgi:uncharacterized protein (TIGR02217 family)
MAFDAVRLPVDIEQGAKGGPGFQTTVIQLSGGREQRNVDWSQQRCTFDIGYGIQSREDLQAVVDFFYSRQGKARGFLFKDWLDYTADGTRIGTGDGVTTVFPLVKTYGTYHRYIMKADSASLAVYKDDVLTTAYSFNSTTAEITFSVAPANGVALTADFTFDVPVRFDTDVLNVALTWEEAGSIPSIQLVEIRV